MHGITETINHRIILVTWPHPFIQIGTSRISIFWQIHPVSANVSNRVAIATSLENASIKIISFVRIIITIENLIPHRTTSTKVTPC